MIPYRFDADRSARSVHDEFGAIEAGEETGARVAAAGRLMLTRPQGKLAFATLVDSTGSIQLFAGAWTDDLDGFSRLVVGTWVGVTGEVVKTRRGELSVKVAEWVVLAEVEEGRTFGDKWHGVTDPDTRFRQRYVDLWANEGARNVFVLRSRVVSLMRRWLEERGYMEVETPLLHPIPGGAEAKPFMTHHNALGMDLYLRIAPELYLKRLIVGGFEKVFEIGRVFRNEGLSTRHNPEFTLLELYEAYADYQRMAEVTEELIAHIALETRGTTRIAYGGRDLDLTPPWRRATMTELIEEHAGIHVSVDMDVDRLQAIATEHGVHVEKHWGSGKLVLEIFEKTTEQELWGPLFVLDYPKEVSPLARDHREVRGLVERFEPIVAGRELGNAFSELADPAEQRARFEDQVRARSAGDEEAMAYDADYVRALEYGLPPTGGLGIGIDRLVMLLADVHTIRDVIFFPTLRPEQD